MDRFIYRKEQRTSDLQRFDLPNRAEMLGLKLAAAEAQLIELKTLLEEAKSQRAGQHNPTSHHADDTHDLKKAG